MEINISKVDALRRIEPMKKAIRRTKTTGRLPSWTPTNHMNRKTAEKTIAVSSSHVHGTEYQYMRVLGLSLHRAVAGKSEGHRT